MNMKDPEEFDNAHITAEMERKQFQQAVTPAVPDGQVERFPVLGTGSTIPWSVAELAYLDYSRKYGGGQSLGASELAEAILRALKPVETDGLVEKWRKAYARIPGDQPIRTSVYDALKIAGVMADRILALEARVREDWSLTTEQADKWRSEIEAKIEAGEYRKEKP